MNDTATAIGFWAIVKNSTYALAFFSAVNYIGFNPESLAVYVALMLMDTCVGIARAWIVDGKHTLTSNSLKIGVSKKLLTITALFALGLSGHGVGFNVQPLVQGVVNVFILAELYSILGNVHSALTGERKAEFDAVGWLLGHVATLIRKAVEQ